MHLIIGGVSQGQMEYARAHFQGAHCMENFHETIKQWLEAGLDPLKETERMLGKCGEDTVILLDEVGSGIVPIGRSERRFREAVGQVGCLLAERAETVTRMVCGIPQVIKGEKHIIEIAFIRHGSTPGNQARRYIGRTDESVSDESLRQCKAAAERGAYPSPEMVICSSRLRCRQTADTIFPEIPAIVDARLDECDFGDFEGKCYDELNGNPAYQRWIDSGGTVPFPNGEDPERFRARCREGFLDAVRRAERFDIRRMAFVIHGGTIMSVLSAYAVPTKAYFEWHVEHGGCCRTRWDGEHLIVLSGLAKREEMR